MIYHGTLSYISDEGENAQKTIANGPVIPTFDWLHIPKTKLDKIDKYYKSHESSFKADKDIKYHVRHYIHIPMYFLSLFMVFAFGHRSQCID